MSIYEKLKPYLKDYLRDMHGLTENDLKKPFRCLNPNHEDKHPSMAFNKEKNFVYCFSCHKQYDIVSLATQDMGDKDKAIKKLKELYLTGKGEREETAYLSPSMEKSGKFTYPTDKAPVIDYLSHKRGLLQAERLTNMYHLVSDGGKIYFPHRLSDQVGGEEERATAKSRTISESDHCHRYKLENGAKPSFYSPMVSLALQSPTKRKLFFLFEGELDYLSFEDLRLNGDLPKMADCMLIPVAVSSTSNVTADKTGLFCSMLDGIERSANKAKGENETSFDYGFILAFDDDKSGKEATKTAKAVIKNHGLKCCSKPFYCNGCKDLNESIIKDRQATAKGIADIVMAFDGLSKEEARQTLEDYIKANSAKAELEGLFSSLGETAVNPVKTHYKALDTALEGEITGGSVVTIGAMSSVGKTTFLLQMAEQMAIEEERDILYFNLEQSTRDLIAKSLSRLTFLTDTQGKIAQETSENAKTAVGISQGRRYQHYTAEEKALINEARKTYAIYADHLYFCSPVGEEIGLSGKDIAERVENHIEVTGCKPVVMVDYLQIMKPIRSGQSDKEAVEQNFLALKSLASKHNLVVFLLCAVNRGSYGGFVEMDSLKESGMIEYSSDYLLGVNYEESRQVKKPKDQSGKKRDDDRQAEEFLKRAKGEPIANIVVNILKNRNGKIGDEIKFKYFKLFNCFVCNGLRNDLDRIFLEDTEKMAVEDDKDLPF